MSLVKLYILPHIGTRAMLKPITDNPDPLPDNPETVGCFRYSGEIKVHTQP